MILVIGRKWVVEGQECKQKTQVDCWVVQGKDDSDLGVDAEVVWSTVVRFAGHFNECINFWLYWVVIVAPGLLLVAVPWLPHGVSCCEACALGHLESSQARCGNRVPCSGRLLLNH